MRLIPKVTGKRNSEPMPPVIKLVANVGPGNGVANTDGALRRGAQETTNSPVAINDHPSQKQTSIPALIPPATTVLRLKK